MYRTSSFLPMITLLVALLSVLLMRTPAAAAIPSAGDTENYLRMIWGLLIVLGIILILYGLVKKRFSLLATSPRQEIKVVEVKPLLGKKALCLVEVRGREYLIGIGGDTVTHLATLGEKGDLSFAETLAATGENPRP